MKNNNPGIINTKNVIKSIANSGGHISSKTNPDGSIHTTAQSGTENRRVSWNTDKNGNISNVHSTTAKDGTKNHMNYKGGK